MYYSGLCKVKGTVIVQTALSTVLAVFVAEGGVQSRSAWPQSTDYRYDERTIIVTQHRKPRGNCGANEIKINRTKVHFYQSSIINHQPTIVFRFSWVVCFFQRDRMILQESVEIAACCSPLLGTRITIFDNELESM